MAIAVRALRADKDARSALGALDEYQRLFPRGRFSVEADILRIDALTAENRRDEALRALDGLDLSRIPGALERHVQRGELRARAERWREARSDFEWVLFQSPAHDGDLLERAMWGRSESWQQEGRLADAREGAASYLQRFPHGRFVVQASLLVKTADP